MKRQIVTIAAILALTASCQGLPSGQIAKQTVDRQLADVCDILPPITYDGEVDTPKTKEQIKRHNATRDALCK